MWQLMPHATLHSADYSTEQFGLREVLYLSKHVVTIDHKTIKQHLLINVAIFDYLLSTNISTIWKKWMDTHN